MNSDLSLEFLRVVEQAAIACAHTMGQGDGHKSDQAAVEAMRRTLDTVPIDGTIVIGEGERDEAPMLYIGEKVGLPRKAAGRQRTCPKVDIAVDPLEGTNLCATGAPNALAVLAASDERRPAARARPLHGEAGRRAEREAAVSLDAPVAENLRAIARSPRARRRGPGRHRARSAAARSADRGDSRDRRAHPPDLATATCRPASPPRSSAAACTR